MNPNGLIHVSEPASVAAFHCNIAKKRGAAADVTNDVTDGRGPICVIDDDDWVCDSLSILLETYGYAVHAYTSGAEFLADERRGKARCVIVDQHMPGLDGLEVVRELRRQAIRVPAILITGRLDAKIVRDAAEHDILGILEKPFPVARLVELIERAVDPQN